MADFGAAVKMAYAPSSRPVPDVDPIAHLPREAWEPVVRLRFVPLSYFVSTGNLDVDRGIERLLYVQSFIEEDDEF